MTWAALAIALAIAGPWARARFLRVDVEATRNRAPGALLHLSGGVTHARWHGPEDGPVLVCIHGLTTASHVWDPLIPFLTGLGYNVLTYDLYGRGYSDRAPGVQTGAFFVSQLRELLEAEGVNEPVTFMGYSMGGAIAVAHAAEAPDEVASLILLAPSGLGGRSDSFTRFVVKTPVIGDWLNEVIVGARMRRDLRRKTFPDDTSRAIALRMGEELKLKGTLAAVLSSQRNFLAEDRAADHASIAQAGTRVLAIWADRDEAIAAQAQDRLARINPQARQVTLPRATHALPYTHAAEIAAILTGDD